MKDCTCCRTSLNRVFHSPVNRPSDSRSICPSTLQTQWTALHYAAKQGNLALIKILLNFGARRDIIAGKGRWVRDDRTTFCLSLSASSHLLITRSLSFFSVLKHVTCLLPAFLIVR